MNIAYQRTGLPVFAFNPSWQDRCILVSHSYQTDIDNVMEVVLWILKLGWPPVKRIHFCANKDEWIKDG